MSGYTKLFSSIIASTIWREDNDTRIVWITMLAMADRYGIVEASIPGLSDMARVDVDGTRRSILKLMSPDPDSRSNEYEGRRIEKVEGGWLILNHGRYREKLNEDDRREYQRKWQAARRSKTKPVDALVDVCRQVVTEVDDVDTSRGRVQKQKQSTEAEAGAVAPARVNSRPLGARSEHASHAVCGRVCLPAFLFREFIQLRGGPEDEARADVDAWALAIVKALSDDEPLGDPLKFWRARWQQRFPTKSSHRTTAAPTPIYDDDWCDHDPPCNSREWHNVKIAQGAC
jgi:hypothetical protein